MTDSAPRCPLSNLPCQPSCAWCRKSVNADGAVTFRCAVLVGANALHRIASDLHNQKSVYNAILKALSTPVEPAKRVRINEDTMKPDTTPPSVCVENPTRAAVQTPVSIERRKIMPQLVTYGGDWNAVELVDAYRAVTERAKGKTLTCSVCGKPFTKTTKGRDPKTCSEPECTKALRKRHQAKSLARTAAKKAGA